MRWVGWSFLLLFLASGGLPAVQGASCASPDRCYASSQVLEDSVTIATGDVTIQTGARLTLRDSDLVLRGSPARTLTIEPGAQLVLEGGRLRGELASFHLVVQGLLEAKDGRITNSNGITVKDGGRITWDGGSIAVSDGIATTTGTNVSFSRAAIVTGDLDASMVLAGATKLANVRWNGTGSVTWSGAFAATALVARGPAFACLGGTVDVRDSELRVPGGTALSTHSCVGAVARTRLDGRNGWQSREDGDVLAQRLNVTSSHGPALSVTDGGPLQLADSTLVTNTQPAVDLGAGSEVLLVRIDAVSNATSAVRCQSAAITAISGSWRGQGAGATLTSCTGRLEALSLTGRGAAIRWDNKPAGGAVLTTPVLLRNLAFSNLTGGGDGIPYAYDLRVAGTAEGLRSTASTLGLARWTALATDANTFANATSGGGLCSVDVVAGNFHVRNLTATAGSRALCGRTSTLQLSGSDLSKATVPLALQSTQATLLDVRLNATRNTIDASSTVEARRAFAPQAAYKNFAAAPGASIAVRSLDNTSLSSGTAGNDGRAPPLFVEVLRQSSTGLTRAPDLRVRVTLGTLSNDTRLAVDAYPLRVVLRDDVAPTSIGPLRRANATIPDVKLDWDAATDDHATPSYEVRVRSPPGAKAVFANGSRQAVDDVRMLQGTSTQLTLPAQGLFWVNVTAVDRSGNRGPTRGLEAVWDTTLPRLQVSFLGASSAGWFRGPVQVVVNGTDGESGIAGTTISMGGVAVQGHILDASGVHLVNVTVRDHAVNRASQERTVRIDREPPTPMTVALAAGRTAEAIRLNVTAQPADARSGVAEVRVWFEVDGVRLRVDTLQAPMPAQLPVSLPRAPGGILLLETVDVAGNSAFSDPLTIAALKPLRNVDLLDGAAEGKDAPSVGLAWAMIAVLLALASRRTSFNR